MNITILPLGSAMFMAVLIIWCAFQAWQTAASATAGPAASISALKPCFFATGAWAGLYYMFLFLQSWSSFVGFKQLKQEAANRGEKAPKYADVKYSRGGAQATIVQVMDRTVGNYMEQSLPLLVGLFFHAFLVSPASASAAAWVWVLSRTYYPLVYKAGSIQVFASTLPGYVCIWYLWQRALLAACAL